ncbi:hypothetical protein G4Y79_05640 [Phototrophicus methaneseepsis]|uniref:Uncharacterized protein n=1 Tax=Phototrophicus methaneseepsis TaxID=2710758 RepID=A0A7S8IFQ9_9CHLR|nr:hypothetical protein [Phototrophicus methaneseepsis]QPC83862.1 hypothetical protein G4Y79_05640 [Phototrophicus methaneseepsis]
MQANPKPSNIDSWTPEILEALFKRLPTGIIILGSDGSILRYNSDWQSFCQQYFPQIASILQPAINFLSLFPQAKSTLNSLFAPALNGETSQAYDLDLPAMESVIYCPLIMTPVEYHG